MELESLFSQLFTWLGDKYPITAIITSIIGSIVVILTAIDAFIDDSKDKGFMKVVLNVPVLGSFLHFLTRFSILRGDKETTLGKRKK